MNYYLFPFFFIVAFFLFAAMFYHDYDTIASNVKGSRYQDLIQAEKEYKDNGCYTKSSGVCALIKTKMKNLQDKQPPIITVLISWISEGIISLLSKFNFYTSMLFVIIILALNFQKLIKIN